ncbi:MULTISPECIES: FAD-dependent oxidoreductase [unclassified Ruegeria]|uniref:FAD-dependent oxidoreductase n=1 Tax=unclassified Ruegeria TaxID=2625375 RepID=UPI0014884A68|nr:MULTISPECIES: FAD-dependent oxidoreductase [unclassified Ruegeria]NOC92937.1 FAD-dependent oxidoreductase [Ruegeria sp. HKCCD6604]
MSKSSVIVVGGGIVGVMTALTLQRRGEAVTLIDRWEPGHSRASSTDYNRVIRAISGRDEFYTRWARESRLRWLELQAESGQNLMYECGALILATAGHCDWEDATAQTFDRVGVPYYKFGQQDIESRFPQFKVADIEYALFEPEAGMLMAHRCVLTGLDLFRKAGGRIRRGRVTTDGSERPMLDGKPLEADLIIMATGPWMADMFPRTIKPISTVVGVNVLYTSTPDGSEDFDMSRMPCWIDHGQGSFGLPSSEGSGVKAAVVIPDKIDLDNDERLIRQETLGRTRSYIRHRLPGLEGQRVVDSKFNQIILTPDTHFIVDWHPEHENVLFAGGCSGHLFKHAPVFAEFAAGVGLKDFGTADRFKISGRRKLSPKESPSGR